MDEQGERSDVEASWRSSRSAVVRKRRPRALWAVLAVVARGRRRRSWSPPPTTTATSGPVCPSTWPGRAGGRRRRGRRRLVDAGVGHLRRRRRPPGARRRGHRLPPVRRRRRGPGARARRRPRPRRRRRADGPTGRGRSPASDGGRLDVYTGGGAYWSYSAGGGDCVAPMAERTLVSLLASRRERACVTAGRLRSRRRRRATRRSTDAPCEPAELRRADDGDRRPRPATASDAGRRLRRRCATDDPRRPSAPSRRRDAAPSRPARRGRGPRRSRSTSWPPAVPTSTAPGSTAEPGVTHWFVTVEPVVDGIPSGPRLLRRGRRRRRGRLRQRLPRSARGARRVPARSTPAPRSSAPTRRAATSASSRRSAPRTRCPARPVAPTTSDGTVTTPPSRPATDPCGARRPVRRTDACPTAAAACTGCSADGCRRSARSTTMPRCKVGSPTAARSASTTDPCVTGPTVRTDASTWRSPPSAAGERARPPATDRVRRRAGGGARALHAADRSGRRSAPRAAADRDRARRRRAVARAPARQRRQRRRLPRARPTGSPPRTAAPSTSRPSPTRPSPAPSTTETTVPDTVEPEPDPVPEPQPCEVLEEDDAQRHHPHRPDLPHPGRGRRPARRRDRRRLLRRHRRRSAPAGRRARRQGLVAPTTTRSTGWADPGERHEGGTFTLDAEDHGTFVGDAEPAREVADPRAPPKTSSAPRRATAHVCELVGCVLSSQT